MRKLSILFLLLIFSNVTLAEKNKAEKPRIYDVEVIIFEDNYARYLNSEQWPQHAVKSGSIIESEALAQADKPKKTNKVRFKNVKPKILKREYKRIHNSKEYNVLFYASWRQVGLSAKKAFKIDLKQLKNNHKKNSEGQLTGNLKLVLARYLHIYNDLSYQQKTTETKVVQTAINGETTEEAIDTPLLSNNYPMKTHRRMRSKKLHYIDHPLVGMLIQINPVKIAPKKSSKKI